MPNRLKTLPLTVTLVILGAVTTTSGIAGTFITGLPNQTFNFTGACTDCNGQGTGTLTMVGSYALGTAISNSNFVSFTYNATNLQGAFTINSASLGLSVSGLLPSSLPAAASVVLNTNSLSFSSGTNGSWSVTNNSNLRDFGTAGTWASASVPEPATMGLLGLGLVAVTLLGRRRSKKK